jgi:hypothetical protein
VLVWFGSRTWPGTINVFDQDSEGTARAPSFLFWHHAEIKEEKMVKQRFQVLFRRWLFTVMKMVGPILLFEVCVLVRQHLQYLPLSISDLLLGALLAFLLTGLLCWLWALGEWLWSKLRRLRGFLSELRQYSRSYWNREAVRTNKA